MDTLSLDGDVVVVTGGSRGLGRAHVLALADAGARVVVGGRSEATHETVEAVRAAGGTATASVRDVRDGAAVVADAVHAYGRIDAVVVNAGIVRDRTFRRISRAVWDETFDVNVHGAYEVLSAAWPLMVEASHGRVVITTSTAGVLGNVGQANYAATKGALIGLGLSLAREGERHGILVNLLAPVARTPMTEGVLPDAARERLDPALVAPLVVAMCSRRWTENGQLVEAGGGWFSVRRSLRSGGHRLPAAGVTPAAILERWPDVTRIDETATMPTDVFDTIATAAGGGDPVSDAPE